LKSALSAKFQEDRVVIWEHARLEQSRTKEFVNVLNELASESVLFVDGPFFEKNFVLAGRNLPHVKMVTPTKITLHDILKKDKIVITLPALGLLKLWLSKSKEDRLKWKQLSKKVFSGNADKVKAKGRKAHVWRFVPLFREQGKAYKEELTQKERKLRAKYARRAQKARLRASSHARVKWKVIKKEKKVIQKSSQEDASSLGSTAQ
jgi:hypothetical protein